MSHPLRHMTDTDLKSLNLPDLIKALDNALLEIRNCPGRQRANYLAFATRVNDEISTRYM